MSQMDRINKLGKEFYDNQTEENFTKLYSPLRSSLYFTLYKFPNLNEDEKELVLDMVLEKIYFRINTYKTIYAFSTWVHNICFYEAVQFVKKRKDNYSYNKLEEDLDTTSDSFGFLVQPEEDEIYEKLLHYNDIIKIIKREVKYPVNIIIIKKYFYGEKFDKLTLEYGYNTTSSLRSVVFTNLKRLKNIINVELFNIPIEVDKEDIKKKREYRKDYYENNKTKIKETAKIYQKENREKLTKYHKEYKKRKVIEKIRKNK